MEFCFLCFNFVRWINFAAKKHQLATSHCEILVFTFQFSFYQHFLSLKFAQLKKI